MAATARVLGAPAVLPVDLTALSLGYDAVPALPVDTNGLALAGLVQRFSLESFFEIGTFRGAMTLTLASSCREGWTLDLPDADARSSAAHEVGDLHLFQQEWDRGVLLNGRPEADRVTLLTGDSGSYDFSPWHRRVGLVYIDGSHLYDSVVSDTRNAEKMIADGCVIAWDDYPYYTSVWRCVNEFARDKRPGEVVHVRGTRLALYRAGGFG